MNYVYKSIYNYMMFYLMFKLCFNNNICSNLLLRLNLLKQVDMSDLYA